MNYPKQLVAYDWFNDNLFAIQQVE